eukprot:m.257822 g.257822  ORF g.257822 m.257822 type:complete len:59 (+) comp26604_c0_seq1:303-479(+)
MRSLACAFGLVMAWQARSGPGTLSDRDITTGASAIRGHFDDGYDTYEHITPRLVGAAG